MSNSGKVDFRAEDTVMINLESSNADRNSSLGIVSIFTGATLVLATRNWVCILV